MPHCNSSGDPAASGTAPARPSFVLLDDQLAPAGQARSRLYQGLHRDIGIAQAGALDAALAELQAELAQGRHAVMLLSYELGEALHGLPERAAPASRLLVFEQMQRLDAAQTTAWLQAQAAAEGAACAPLTGLRANVDRAQFADDVARIHRYIAAGETYQVNHCLRLDFRLHGSPLALYLQLRAQQAVAYGALACLPEGRWVLSRSPELFVAHQGGWLTAQPMKGTAAVGQALDLASDAKNRAENVMIVDLLRNDLGRVAEPGSVSVPQRFEVHRFGEVLQMTSTVRARLRPGVAWPELLRALFPCGSITGAPKRRTMEIIRTLEPRPRGLYTGAIGWVEPPPQPGRVGDFCLSVPIRTLTLAPTAEGPLAGELGVGAGITWDSRADDEWAECQLKARFVSQLAREVALFETLHASRQGVAHLERHLARLQRSAAQLGFAHDEAAIRARLAQACQALPEGPHRLRLSLQADGRTELQAAPLTPLAGPVRVLLAPEATDASDLFLAHKTTQRACYDAAWRAAEAQGAFDMLFFNQRGELTEGGRSNVFVQLGGRWYTPPLAAGVLPGVMRSVLLDDPTLAASERRITRDDLLGAQALRVCNALRGALPAVLDATPQPALAA